MGDFITRELIVLIEVIGFVGAGIWIVATIRATTAELNRTIERLTKAVLSLDEAHDHTRERLVAIETKLDAEAAKK